MSPRLRVVFASVCLGLTLLPAQIPPSRKLSAEENRFFTQEINHVRDLLGSANDKGAIEFQIARTYAAGGQYQEAMDWLRKVVDSNLGFDPSRDRLFAKLSGTREFQSLEAKVRIHTPPISNSRLVSVLPETDLFPENLAYDPATKNFYLGSTYQDEIVRCNQKGACEPFVTPHREGLGYVLGLKIHQKALWATSNTENGASLRHYSLMIARFALTPDGPEITGMTILERRNPLFDGITTGALVGNQLYYIANSQLDKIADGKIKAHVKLDALRILAIPVP